MSSIIFNLALGLLLLLLPVVGRLGFTWFRLPSQSKGCS